MEETNIEMNGVQYEIKSLIEFSSLAKLLIDLSKRQKDLEQNILSMTELINEKDNRLTILEQKILAKESHPNITSNEIQLPEIVTNEINQQTQNNRENIIEGSNTGLNINDENLNNNNINDKNDINNKENNQTGKNGNIKEEKNKEKIDNDKNRDYLSENGNDNESEDIFEENEDNQDIKLNPKMLSKLFKKIKEINRKINKDFSPKIKSNIEQIDNINNQIGQIEEINKKFLLFQEEFDKMKVKVEDFNIYEIFKGEGSQDGNTDVIKGLIQALENKIFKKFELYDEKNKKSEESLAKTEENLKNLKGLIDNLKNISQRNCDDIKEIKNNSNDYKNKMNKILEDLNNKIEILKQDMPKTDNSKGKINEIQEKLNEFMEKPRNSVIIKQNDKRFEEFNDLIEEMRKTMEEMEKNLNQKMEDEYKIISEKIESIENDIQSKADSKEISIIENKIYNLEENKKVMNNKLDQLEQHSDKFKKEISNIFKKLENLEGEILQIKNDIDKNSFQKNEDLESGNYLLQPIFNLYKKEINSKLEKIKTDIEHLFSNFETISNSLKTCPNNQELTKFQNNLISLFEEFKSTFHKKYMDRSEIQKALKVIEHQIKALTEASKKNEGGDTWLLAKKPIGNYQCASCESNLKDLEQKDNFIPWNKYPIREEKTYRIGHGYSRILEMVNEEVIKNYESKDNKGYASDDDKIIINSKKNSKNNSKNKENKKIKHNESSNLTDKKKIKLPKVNKKILNINNDNLRNSTQINHNFRLSTSPYKSSYPINMDEPRVTKIYKINNKRVFEFNKTRTEGNTAINIINEKINKKNIEKNNFIKMNLTNPDNN